MRQIIITIAFIGCQSEKAPSPVQFKTTVFNVDNQKDSIRFSNWQKVHLSNKDNQKPDTLFLQDSIPVGELYCSEEQFAVYDYSMREFGGALMFQDKNSMDSIYYLECSCPVMIDKRADGYYITESLAHGRGFGKSLIFQITERVA